MDLERMDSTEAALPMHNGIHCVQIHRGAHVYEAIRCTRAI